MLPPRLARFIILVAAALAATATLRAQSLPGLALTGNNFTYDAPDGAVSGIFLKPAGDGPFPAVLISHGKGGSATAFSLAHAQNLVRWGFVCIGPNYTHAGTGSTPDNEGYSPENSRRARRCLAILAATPGVDPTRVAAFSHSMGSYLTIGLAGELPAHFRAVAIAAGGTSGTANAAFAAPATPEAQPILSPMILFHGTADTTVAPIQSENLRAILQANNVPHERLLYQGANHNIVDPPIRRDETYAMTRAWFTRHGVLPAGGNTAPTIAAPATVTVAPGVASAPIPFTVGDAQTPAGALVVQAFSLDADVVATPPSAAYTGKLPAPGLAVGGTGTARTLTLTPRAGQTGTVEVVLVVSEPEVAGSLAAMTRLQVNVSATATPAPPVSTGDARLANLSARGSVTAAEPLIAGFVLEGTGMRTLLIRSAGPVLAGFGVAGALADPRLQLFRGGTALTANDDWSAGATPAAEIAAAGAVAGAFALPPASKDAALLVTLAPGSYSAHAQTAAAPGVALLEIYDAGGDPGARLANLSVRNRTEAGAGTLIAGFVVAGTGSRALLVRAVGPALGAFGVADTLPDPSLQLFAGAVPQLANDDWSLPPTAAMLAAFAAQAGAFALPAASRDAALATALPAGAYSAVVTAAPSTTPAGTALIELYAP